MTEKLTPAERAEHMPRLEAAGWRHDGARDAISKTYTFGNFVEAFGFMTRAALEAEKAGHHPEWSNVFKTVEVTLTTHDADGLSAKDVALAEAFDRQAG